MAGKRGCAEPRRHDNLPEAAHLSSPPAGCQSFLGFVHGREHDMLHWMAACRITKGLQKSPFGRATCVLFSVASNI